MPLLFRVVGIAPIGPICRHDHRRVFRGAWPLLAIAVLAAVSATAGLLTNVQRYAVGMPRGQASIAAVMSASSTAWWPDGFNVPPWTIWVGVSAAFLLAIVVGLYLAGGRRLGGRRHSAHAAGHSRAVTDSTTPAATEDLEETHDHAR